MAFQLVKQLGKVFIFAWLVSLLCYADVAHAFDPTKANVATMLENFGATVPSLMRLVTAIAYVMGFFFVIKGVIAFRHIGEGKSMMREHSLKEPLIYFFVGAMLIYLPSTVQVGIGTFWETTSPLAYVKTDEDPFSEFISSCFMIVQLVGVISLIRGLVILTHMGQSHGQPGQMGRALAHIIAGVL